MTEIEFELTYLARYIPKEITGEKPIEMVDMYIPKKGIAHPTLRLRKKGGAYELTKKVPVIESDSSEQFEHTIPLNELEYNALKRSNGRYVEKDRYQVYIQGYPADVDIFKGALAGLVLIDFEFMTKTEKESFLPPEVCLQNVTQDEMIAGGYLAGKSYDDIAESLAKLGYTKLA